MGVMTLEYLDEQKLKYQSKADYFKHVGFDNLAADFQSVVELIGKIEDCIKEKENGKD